VDVVVVGVAGGSLLVLMIETPHTLHTQSRSTLYICKYKVFQHLLQWLVVRCNPSLFLTCNVLYAMITTPHPLHTLIRSSSYICYVFQHLLLWLVVTLFNPSLIYAGSHSQSGGSRRFSLSRFLTWIMLLGLIK
jgi:hypothetical protein